MAILLFLVLLFLFGVLSQPHVNLNLTLTLKDKKSPQGDSPYEEDILAHSKRLFAQGFSNIGFVGLYRRNQGGKETYQHSKP